MKKSLIAALSIGAAALMSDASASALQAPAPAVRPPVLDGILDDDCWEYALKIDKFNLLNSSVPAKLKTDAYIAYDAQNLYFAVRSHMPDGAKIKSNAKDPYSNDHIEIMIDPNASQMRYFHYIFDVKGNIYDAWRSEGGFVGDAKWAGGAKCAVKTDSKGWTLEARVPISTMDVDTNNRDWAFNFARSSWELPHAEESSITKSGLFHNAGEFVPVKGMQIDILKYAWDISDPTVSIKPDGDKFKITVELPVKNRAAKPQEILADMTIDGGTAGINGQSFREKFSAVEQRQLAFRDMDVDKPGSYKIVMDLRNPINKQLLKRKIFYNDIAFAPVRIDLITPWYRNMIFASQKLTAAEWMVTESIDRKTNPNAQIVTGIKDAAGKIYFSKELTQSGKVTAPIADLPDGKYLIFADAGKAGSVTIPLRKVPHRPGEIWMDRDGIWRNDGKPFYPIFNWGRNHIEGTMAKMGSYWSEFAKDGRMLASGDLVWSGTPTQKYLRVQRIDKEGEEIIRNQVRKILSECDKRGEKLFAFMLADEPEISNIRADVLFHYAELVRDEAPWYPLIVDNNSVPGISAFYRCGEINGLHPYPNPAIRKPRNNFERLVVYFNQARTYNESRGSKQSIFLLQQSFNYGDCGSLNSRVPTFDEIRTQYILTVTLGANGVEFFNFTEPHYPELRIGLNETGKEMAAAWSKPMITPDFKGATSSNKQVTIRVKKVDENYWIFAAGNTAGSEKSTITVPGLGNRKLYVFREGRTVTPQNGAFTETFNNFDAHIYTTDSNDYGLRSVADVEAEIKAENDKRRKPGNIAYQEFELDKLEISTSSNGYNNRRANNTLWHVADGICTGEPADAPMSGLKEGMLVYTSEINPAMPVWLKLEFPKPEMMGRIAVYGADKTLCDYTLEVRTNGKWHQVGSATGQKDDFREFKFTPVMADGVRINVSKVNPTVYGKRTINRVRIHEVEVYAK